MTADINSQKLVLFNTINVKNSLNESFKDQQADKLAGFLQNGKFSWIALDGMLRVISTDTGEEIAYYNFAKHHGVDGCLILHVEEITYFPGICLLAVIIEFTNSSARAGMISIFCTQGSKILGSMDMSERITCCKFISWEACRRSVLRQYHGALAVGTDQGKLFLVDLMIPKDIKEIVLSPSYDAEIFPMINVPADLDQIQITHHHKKVVSSRETGEKSFFSIQMKQVLEETGSIISMLCMPNLYMMAVGLDDGRMILYDLIELQAFHLAYPPGNRAPLTHMSYFEPADDPRSAVYVWTFHSSKDGAIAVMHSIMFDTKVNGFYENFRSCSVRLTMPIFHKDTFPICCRAITKTMSQDEEDILTINLLAWTSPTKKRTHVMIFDLNQWYKEEMPSVGDWRNCLKYTVVFEIPNVSLDVILDEKSLLPFNSIMRPEEHFYPNSLSFDLIALETEKFLHYRWKGIQNLVLQQFYTVGPQMILEPSFYFNELIQVAITPQFYDVNFGIASPLDLKREFLLSVALDYNYTEFLRKCAWAWADGSYLGKDGAVGVGLSTLTEWIWNRVRAIKEICNQLCQPLFDYSEQRIDCGTQKQLSLCCKQLKILSDLLQMIAKDYQKYIPESIRSQIQTQANTVKMAAEYQEVLQWLLNVGLLPEGHYDQSRGIDDDNDFVIVPYPYRTIKSHYASQRAKLNDSEENDAEKPAKYLFIDAFIENECCNYELLDWGCLYPPKSIQSLLRSLLVPDIPIENKYVIFIYLFMDITNALNDSSYSSIVRNLIKFPAVFKMNPSAIKRTQAFWNLDNGQLETAVEELISPLSNDRYLPKWQRELLIGALLKQNANSFALRALRCPGNLISSELEVSTLLANNLISEALKIQRASGDRSLLEKLFHKILHSSNYEQLLDLALSEEEGKVLREYLQTADLSNCVNLHFVYLLQRSKFIDAAQLMDSFSSNTTNINLDPPKQVLNAYYSTMEPTTRKLTSMVYSDHPIKVNDVLAPFSATLIKSRCNASNDIYKKCIQSITEANYNSSQEIREMPFIGTPKLGIFEYRQPTVQMHEISYPMEINEHGKRPQNDNNNGIFRMEDFEGPKTKRRKLEEVIDTKKNKSFVDKRISLLTNFRNRKPKLNLNFTSRTPSTSSRVTPDRVAFFGDLLATPIIEKRTPHKIVPDRAATPASILKTRSCRSSISPTQSRFSEFDDNKSVKSITFAALPGTNDSSLQDSSYLDESFGNEQQMESSAEFYSPEKSPKIAPSTASITSKSSDIVIITSDTSILSGPKARPPIKSRSTTPNEQLSQGNMILSQTSSSTSQESKRSSKIEIIFDNPLSQVQESQQEVVKIMETHQEELIETTEITAQSTGLMENPQLAETVVMDDTELDMTDVNLYNRKSVLKSDNENESENDSADDSSIIDDSILGYERKSVLPHDYGENFDSSSSSDEDEDIMEDEHFEEEELPEHSDYDDEDDEDENQKSSDSCEYGNVDLDDTDESSQENEPNKIAADDNDVIEIIDSDDDDDVQIESNSSKLPSISEFDKQPQQEVQNIDEASNQDRRELLELATAEMQEELRPTSSKEEMINILYDDIEEVTEDIESPPFEEISPSKPKSPEPMDSTDNVLHVKSDTEIDEASAVDDKVEENVKICEETVENSNNAEGSEATVEISEAETAYQSIEAFSQEGQSAVTLEQQVVDIEDIQLIEEATEVVESTTQEEAPINTETFDDIQLVDVVPEKNVPNVEENTEVAKIENCDEIQDAEIAENVEEAPKEPETSDNKPNCSEISADYSFISAQNDLNEAAFISNDNTLTEVSTDVKNEINTQDEMATKEVTEIMDNQDTEELKEVDNASQDTLNVAVLEQTVSDVNEEIEMTENSTNESNVLNKAVVEDVAMETEHVEDPVLIEDKAQIEEDKVSQEVKLDDPTSPETQQEEKNNSQDANDKEIEDIMRKRSPTPSQSVPVDLSTPKRRGSRAKSETAELESSRMKRAVSVPSSGTSSPISRSSRASSEIRHNPKVLLKEKMLERIEESPSGILTRNKSRLLLEQHSRETTPHSRAPSEEVESGKKTPRRRSTATPTTPRRILTRAASRDSYSGENVVSSSQQAEEKTPEEPTPVKRRGRRKASVDEEEDETKSVKSTRSTSSRKKETPTSSNKISPVPLTSPSDELSVSTRRLTRSQLNVLEKSRQLTEKMSRAEDSPGRLRATKSDLAKTQHEDDSDNDSVKSDSTSSRTSRKRKLPKRILQESETSSIASKSSKKSKSPQKKHLSVIQEEDSEISDKSVSGKSRRGKK